MKWTTFWGECYPGWHIECSAMSRKYLGEVFDIHTGGIDHIPIHHENEIAQSKGANGKIPANYWMHCEFLQVNGGKMGKSLNNLFTLKDLTEKGYSPLDYKMFNFSAHYRNKINFTFEAMDAAKSALKKLKQGYDIHKNGNDKISEEEIIEYKEKFLSAINDDLNMPQALSVVWEIVKNPNKSNQLANLLLDFDKVLGLKIDEQDKNNIEEIPENIAKIIKKREQARKEKNWKLSDELRDVLNEEGYKVIDSKDGMKIEKV